MRGERSDSGFWILDSGFRSWISDPSSVFRFPSSFFLFLGLCLWLMLGCRLFAASGGEDLFTQANRAFAGGHYADAIRDYETVATKQGFSAPLLFNLANAYFRDGKIGRAILNYERALVLTPKDADIEANLRLARKASGLFIPDPAWWQRATRLLSMDGWAWLAGGSLALSCVGGIMGLLSKRRPWRFVMVLSLVVFSAATTCLGVRWGDFNRAVVLAPETPVRIGPFDTAKSSSALMAGEVVEIQNRHENYFFIRNPDGKSGWVSNQQVERVLKD